MSSPVPNGETREQQDRKIFWMTIVYLTMMSNIFAFLLNRNRPDLFDVGLSGWNVPVLGTLAGILAGIFVYNLQKAGLFTAGMKRYKQ